MPVHPGWRGQVVEGARRVTTRPTNSVHPRGIGTTVPRASSWEALDALPATVRRVIWEAPVSINPIDAAELVSLAGVDDTAVALSTAIRREIAMFAAEHKARYRYDLPHVAAGVTMQRYEATPPSIRRRHPRARG